MRPLHKLALGVAFAATLLGAALAQQIVPKNLSGNECWNAGQGPGGPSTGFVCVNLVAAIQPVATNTGAASFTIANNIATTILTAQPAVSTITLPSSPVSNGAVVEIVNGTAAAFATNVVTIAPNTGQTILGGNVTITNLAQHASVEFRYNLANTTWYQIR